MKLTIKALILLSLVAVWVPAQAGKTGTVSGEAIYRERIAVPPGTQLEVVLADVSRADAPEEAIGNFITADAGQPPYKFEINYPREQIIKSHRYALRARLTHEGKLLFTTDKFYPVITDGNPTRVRLWMKHVAAAAPIQPTAGADRDKHGCIPSAGYTWCARENACVRPWELASQKGFDSDEDAFNRYCSAGKRQ